ncbi:MAG: sigma E protease regulator RseP [Thiohalomonadaceae bacterium]
MLDILLTPLLFIFAISVLIAVHEFGHYWVARRMGVKVLRYSIGFGKPLWLRRSGPDQTEYVIAAIPLGGYVKMLDEREGEVASHELDRAFNRQPLRKRTAIVAAGPLFNLLFAVLAYWLMFVTGTPGMRPLLGEVASASLAYQAGLRSGQEVLAVDGRATPTWGALLESLLPYALRKETVTVTVNDGGVEYRYQLPFDQLQGEVDASTFSKVIGLQPYRPPIAPVLDEITPDSAAARAGLQAGDEILAIDGIAVTDWEDLVRKVREHPDTDLQFRVRRGGEEFTVKVRPVAHETVAGRAGRIGAGVRLDPQLAERLRSEWRLGPVAALGAALHKTWDMSSLTVRMLGEMVVGRVSTENISGPITIAVYARSSALAGFAQFLAFLAVVSISLGILNLLPVPILDGGHLLFYLIEAIKGSPVSEQTEAMAARIGIALVLMLMTLAMYNDVARLMGGE